MIGLIEFFEFNLILFTSIVLVFIFFFLLIFFPLKESKNKRIDKAKTNELDNFLTGINKDSLIVKTNSKMNKNLLSN